MKKMIYVILLLQYECICGADSYGINWYDLRNK